MDAEASTSSNKDKVCRLIIQQCLSANLSFDTEDEPVSIGKGMVVFVCFLQKATTECLENIGTKNCVFYDSLQKPDPTIYLDLNSSPPTMSISLSLRPISTKSFLNSLLRGLQSTINPLSIEETLTPSPGVRHFSIQSLSQLKGRDLYTTENYGTNDLHSLLWIAHDLKYNKNDLSKLCKDKSIFFVNQSPLTKIACNIAANRLGITLTCIHESGFDSLLSYGKSLSPIADVIFLETSLKEDELQKIADESSVSVVNVRSLDFAPVMVLAELFTLYEYYGYLRRITIGYIGPGDNPILNSYAIMLPKLGMHLRYCLKSSEMNNTAWLSGAKLSTKFSTELSQKDVWEDAIYRAHTISICPTNDNLFLNKKDITEMELKWSILHHNIHEAKCVSNEILNSKQCLVWQSISNLSWIFQAIILAKSTDFRPESARPDFEGEP